MSNEESFLNIERGEERLIGLLVLLYLTLTLGFVFIQFMTFGILLADYSYIAVAFFASLLTALTVDLAGVPFSTLPFINLIFIAIINLLEATISAISSACEVPMTKKGQVKVEKKLTRVNFSSEKSP